MTESRPNFFQLLGIDPETPWSDEEFQAVLRAKKLEWTKRSADPRPKIKLQAKQYLDLIPLIQKVMGEIDLREAEAQAIAPLKQTSNPVATYSLIKETPKMSNGSPIFGIDLGTTYSCIAYVDQYGRPTVVQNMEGDRTTPSVVQFSGDERIVGKEAKQSSMLEPDNTIQWSNATWAKARLRLSMTGRTLRLKKFLVTFLRNLSKTQSRMPMLILPMS